MYTHSRYRVFEGDIESSPRHEELLGPLRLSNCLSRTQRQHSLVRFVLGCRGNTSAHRWVPVVGEKAYRRWRDALVEVGWAEWDDARSPGQGWHLARPAWDIISRVTAPSI